MITWLRFLKDHHPDYRYIAVSLDRINALLVDADVSLSFVSVVDHDTGESGQDQPILADLPPLNSQSMVPNLDITTTEIGLICHEQQRGTEQVDVSRIRG